MERSLSDLDLDELKSMFESESNLLHQQLLNGAQWAEVKEQKKKVTAISVLIHKKEKSANTNFEKKTES